MSHHRLADDSPPPVAFGHGAWVCGDRPLIAGRCVCCASPLQVVAQLGPAYCEGCFYNRRLKPVVVIEGREPCH